MEQLPPDQASAQVSDKVRRLLQALGQDEMGAAELMQAVALRHAPPFRKNYLVPALDADVIERTQPDSPRSPTQRYSLTPAGKNAIWQLVIVQQLAAKLGMQGVPATALFNIVQQYLL
ncbi:MAG: hypothetical protein LBD42_04720 [Desulfovibrio sp.]|nr:hypothetical protein [Desulfovibrio sp.]